MPEVCTCGAKLPEDARFCHKCGRPLREEFAEVEETPAPVVVVAPPILPPQFPPIGFHNRLAVRIALFSQVCAFFLSMLSGRVFPQAMGLVWLMGAGFLSVYLYRKRTGQRLSPLLGARLGWLCGIFGFVLTTLLLTGIVVTLSDPAMVAAVREQLKVTPANEAEINQMLEMVRSPLGIFAMLMSTFCLFSILPACGGALGAKLLDRD